MTADDTDDGGRGRERDGGSEDGKPARTVIAQGTFDILHPGHVHYLEEAAAMGDELIVIVARKANVDHKEQPICPATQRRDVVGALEAVDEAILGHEEDIFVPIEEIDPDVIALGHDQHHDESAIEAELERRGVDCTVERASGRDPEAGELLSTRHIIDRVLERRG
ncbi:adenylyltransferase/cytidyltransferase family protein [Halopiger xanaduensis]|uniref:FAD synthase n=1 Tax=Halopiger xanaduensis (strain DSM 18323 / JCM 14033 / SH-6) TaxID=797210 RepID=F8D910_HALXS|nr:adenylyltransferase/cytidyltransferase family protein [Halopiger xanaduensis]AEH37334.1 cytidyltransferase-related domain protein [Halopiger xanaduensis SH-6]